MTIRERACAAFDVPHFKLLPDWIQWGVEYLEQKEESDLTRLQAAAQAVIREATKPTRGNDSTEKPSK